MTNKTQSSSDNFTLDILRPMALIPKQDLSFAATGSAIQTTTSYKWIHRFTDSTPSSPSSCREVNGSIASTYLLNCADSGTLEITLSVNDQVAVSQSTTGAWSIEFAGGSPLPLPSPAPTPAAPNAPNGAKLYRQDCESCHGLLANNNISRRSATGISQAVQSVRSMNSLSFLSSSELVAIANALNEK